MKNYIWNVLSIIAGRRFAKIYANTNSTPKQTDNALDLYRTIRRQLPKDEGRHLGNHSGSKFIPWQATQGFKTKTLCSPNA